MVDIVEVTSDSEDGQQVGLPLWQSLAEYWLHSDWGVH